LTFLTRIFENGFFVLKKNLNNRLDATDATDATRSTKIHFSNFAATDNLFAQLLAILTMPTLLALNPLVHRLISLQHPLTSAMRIDVEQLAPPLLPQFEVELNNKAPPISSTSSQTPRLGRATIIRKLLLISIVTLASILVMASLAHQVDINFTQIQDIKMEMMHYTFGLIKLHSFDGDEVGTETVASEEGAINEKEDAIVDGFSSDALVSLVLDSLIIVDH
jgi:hypothetical protein